MKNLLTLVKDNIITETGSRLLGSHSRKVSPHVNATLSFHAEQTRFKKDYEPDIKFFHSRGMSIDDIASMFNMSTGYARQLLNK